MNPNYKPTQIQKLLNTITWNDTRFHADYSLDPYKNCELGCLYCDSSYDQTIHIKTNAAELLNKEPTDNKVGRILLGTVHDPYQPAENTYQLTRKILQTINKHPKYSIHLLTKTTTLLKDLDLITQLNDPQITISLITTAQNISKYFEPNVPSPTQRLQTIKILREKGITAGLSLMPIIPGITDQNLKKTIQDIQTAQPSYILHKHLELKGDQQTQFKTLINTNYPHLNALYQNLYNQSYQPPQHYINEINQQIKTLCKTYKLKTQVPQTTQR